MVRRSGKEALMPVTIKDVATLAGVSTSTVSRTCSNHPSISRQTKEKVRRAMAELGYEPNFQASNLASQNSRTIGIILPVSEKEAYQNAFYLEIIRGISQFCNRQQYINTIITGQNEEEILQAIRTMSKSGQVEGFIVLYSKEPDEIISYLYEEGLLYVLIGKACQHVNETIYIDNDNVLAAKEATEYLIQLGHTKIAYVSNVDNLTFASDRKAGYLSALTQYHLPFLPEYCVEIPYVLEEKENPVQKLLSSKNRPTAIVVSDDILAFSLEKVALELGLKIPEDLSIISFNNSLFSKLTTPQLTSIDINSYQLGMEAASQIINHIENPNLLATKIIVPYFMVERQSCCRNENNPFKAQSNL